MNDIPPLLSCAVWDPDAPDVSVDAGLPPLPWPVLSAWVVVAPGWLQLPDDCPEELDAVWVEGAVLVSPEGLPDVSPLFPFDAVDVPAPEPPLTGVVVPPPLPEPFEATGVGGAPLSHDCIIGPIPVDVALEHVGSAQALSAPSGW